VTRGRVRATLALLLLVAASACFRQKKAPEPPLRVGTSGDYAPFSIERDGRLEGFDVEVARRMAKDLGRPLELVRFRWPDLLSDLAANRFDVAMGGITIRPERALAGTFTRPVAETGAVALARYGGGSSQKELDRSGVRVGVNRGGHLERVARRLFPHAMVVTVPDNRALPALLDDGAVDAILIDDAEADILTAGPLSTAVRVGPLTRDRKAYLTRDPALATLIDAWIRAHEIDGSLAKLRARELGPSRAGSSTAFATDLSAVMALVDLRLALMPSVAAAKEAAELPVVDEKQEARVLEAVRTRGKALGLEADPIAQFFRAQIEVGREIQQAFLEAPPDSRPPFEKLDLESAARPALAGLTDSIVKRVARLVHDEFAPGRASAARLADELDASQTPAAGRLKIGRALAGLLRVENL
jgi:cyclohexadienyl dehydratase